MCTLSYARGEAIYSHWFCNRQKVGCAVERNRARRLMKEVYRLNQHAIREGYHIVIVGRGPLKNATYEKSGKGNFVSLAKKQIVDTK